MESPPPPPASPAGSRDGRCRQPPVPAGKPGVCLFSRRQAGTALVFPAGPPAAGPRRLRAAVLPERPGISLPVPRRAQPGFADSVVLGRKIGQEHRRWRCDAGQKPQASASVPTPVSSALSSSVLRDVSHAFQNVTAGAGSPR